MANQLNYNHFSFELVLFKRLKNIILLIFLFVSPVCLVNAASDNSSADVDFEAKYEKALESAYIWLNYQQLVEVSEERRKFSSKLIEEKYLFEFPSLEKDIQAEILQIVHGAQYDKKKYMVDMKANKYIDDYNKLLEQEVYQKRKSEILCDNLTSFVCRQLIYQFINDYGSTAIPATNTLTFVGFLNNIQALLHPALGLNESVKNYRSWKKFEEEFDVLQLIPVDKVKVADVIQLFKLMAFMYDFLSRFEALDNKNNDTVLVGFLETYSALADIRKSTPLNIFAEEVNEVLLAKFLKNGNLRLISIYFSLLKDDKTKQLLAKRYQFLSQEDWKGNISSATHVYGERSGQTMQDFYFAVVENKGEVNGYAQFMEAFPNSKHVKDKQGYIATHLREIQKYQHNQKIARIDQYRFYCSAETMWGKGKVVINHYKNVGFLEAGVYDDEGAGLIDKLCQKALESCDSKVRPSEVCKVRTKGWMPSEHVGDRVEYEDVFPDY